MYNSEIVDAEGTDKLDTIIIKNSKSSNTNRMKIDGVFVYIGSKPNSDLVKDYIETDENGCHQKKYNTGRHSDRVH